MADTVRTKSQLLALYANGVIAGISAQDGRDFIATVYPNLYLPEAYGADPTGVSDSTTAIQAAIDAAASAGGGVVLFAGQYLIATNIEVYGGVVLAGLGQTSPFLGATIATMKSMLRFTSTTKVGIQTSGAFNIRGLAFYYPNQVAVTAATPIAYPATIGLKALPNGIAIGSISNCVWINAYDGIDFIANGAIGRCGDLFFDDLMMGCFRYSIRLDWNSGIVRMSNILIEPFWDEVDPAHLGYPQTIDTWVLANSIGLLTGRVDSLTISNWFSFNTWIAMDITDLGNGSTNGFFTNVVIDGTSFGMIITDTNPSGLDIVDCQFLATDTALVLNSGGITPPVVRITNGKSVVVSPSLRHINVVVGTLELTNWRIYGTVTTESILVQSGAVAIKLVNVTWNSNVTGASLTLPNAWGGRATIVGCDFAGTTFTLPATIPTHYEFEGNLPSGWIAYTPTITSLTGTITTVGAHSGRYRLEGRKLYGSFDFTITTNGTGATAVLVTLPISLTAKVNHAFSAHHYTNGKFIQGFINTGVNTLILLNYDGTYPVISGDQISGSFVLEVT